MSTLSPAAQARYNQVAAFGDKVQRVYGLVEQYVAARTSADQLVMPLARAFSQLKLQFMGVGLDRLAQLCGSLEIAVKRGAANASKLRILRDGVGSLKQQLEIELRAIMADDLEAQRRAQREEQETELRRTGH